MLEEREEREGQKIFARQKITKPDTRKRWLLLIIHIPNSSVQIRHYQASSAGNTSNILVQGGDSKHWHVEPQRSHRTTVHYYISYFYWTLQHRHTQHLSACCCCSCCCYCSVLHDTYNCDNGKGKKKQCVNPLSSLRVSSYTSVGARTFRRRIIRCRPLRRQTVLRTNIYSRRTICRTDVSLNSLYVERLRFVANNRFVA